MKIALIQQHASNDLDPFYPQKRAETDVQSLAETIPGPTTDQFAALSKKYGVVTILNLFEKDGRSTFDSSPVIDTYGTILGITRMVHITDLPCFFERGYYTPGDGKSLVFDTAVGRIGIAICYDRHFPEYMRELGRQKAEIVVIPQAGAVGEWPEGLYEAELRVAGFQNGYFTALCNRVGEEECLTFEGRSFIAGPDGRILAQSPALEDHLLFADIDLAEIKECHARKYFMPDRRPEIYYQWEKGKYRSV
jgi:N-carbamoylputrescine amidase